MKYENPKMELIKLNEKDVITASTLTDTGAGGSGGENDDDVIEF